MIKVHCDGCQKEIERVDGMRATAIEGEMRMLMYKEPNNLRDPRMRTQRFSAKNFHWCDECAGIAVTAIKERKGARGNE